MQKNDDQTRQTYDAMALKWTASYEQEKPFWEPEFLAFRTALPNGHILEIGAGGGRDGELLVRNGYEYTGVDNSAGMIEFAKKQHPDMRLFQKDVRKLDFPEGMQFDGFWAAAILLHLPSTQVDAALQQIHHVIRSGGIGMITMREGKGEGLRERVKHGLPDKRYFAHYTQDEFTAILERNGFEVVEANSRPEGDEYVWLSFLVRVT